MCIEWFSFYIGWNLEVLNRLQCANKLEIKMTHHMRYQIRQQTRLGINKV